MCCRRLRDYAPKWPVGHGHLSTCPPSFGLGLGHLELGASGCQPPLRLFAIYQTGDWREALEVDTAADHQPRCQPMDTMNQSRNCILLPSKSAPIRSAQLATPPSHPN